MKKLNILTFQVEQNVALVVLEHLRYQLHVHVLYINFLVSLSVTCATVAGTRWYRPAGSY